MVLHEKYSGHQPGAACYRPWKVDSKLLRIYIRSLDVDARIFDPKKVRMISRSKSGEAEELDATESFERSHRRYAEQTRE